MAEYAINPFTGQMERKDSDVSVRESSITSSITVKPQDGLLQIDASSGTVTLTLIPSDRKNRGKQYIITKIDSSANAVNIVRAGTDTINGDTTLTLSFQWSAAHIVADGLGSWRIV